MKTMRFAAALLIAAGLLLTAACAADPATDHPAARAVQKLLELRADDVRDAESYAPYFLESSLATALAEGSAEPTGTPRIPKWEKPYVSEEASGAASVVVVWKPDAEFPDWPLVNIFSLSFHKGSWLVVDAIEATAAPAPLADEAKGK